MKKIFFNFFGYFTTKLFAGIIFTLGAFTALLGIQAFQNMTTSPADPGNQSLSAPMLSTIGGVFNREKHSLEAIGEAVDWGNKSGTKRVFLTTNKYNGNLGGLSGADDKCQTEVNTNNLGGTWMAVLGDSTTSFRQRFNNQVRNNNYKLKQLVNIHGSFISSSTLPYEGVPKFNPTYYSFLDNSFLVSPLFTLTHNNTIERQILFANGATPVHNTKYEFWSGTQANGGLNNSNCANWTSTNSTGLYGYHTWLSDIAHSDILQLAYTSQGCSYNYHLLCLEL